jgi:hypothetical protein
MKDYSHIIQRIINTYTPLLPQFTESKQQHFRSRLYKISGDKNLLATLQNDTFTTFTESIKNSLEGKRELDLDSRYKLDAPIARQRKRNQFIHNNIDFCKPFLEYLDVLMEYNIIHRYKKSQDLDDQLQSDIHIFLNEKFQYYFDKVTTNPEFLLSIPVQVINLLYWYINIPNNVNSDILESQLFKAVQKTYTPDIINSDEVLFLNYLYTLTHIIIGKSWFYEYKVDSSNIEWIYSEFSTYQEQIFATKEDDIIAEIGLCYTLNITPETQIITIYQEYIAEKINNEYNYLPSGKYPIGSFEDLNLSEHRNILTILLLSNMQHLYEFPL